ncbi:14899_t:CDS:2 [Funneliformis caledonium]|uniref:14899_t:CDS:1 n=1 Tax=Funneliformis caledonium TaxID=1117310 RepID=A0A9N8VRF8_9GLOM|nr:14899_t:CDS:2 [Funneliformis caledonium]
MTSKGKKRQNEQSESRDSKYPRIKVSLDDSVMDVDSSSLPSLSPFPSPLPSSCPSPSMDYSQETIFQYENEVSSELNKMHLNNNLEKEIEVCEDKPELRRDFSSIACTVIKETHIAQNCIREIRNFIENISHLNRLQRFFQTSDINETFNKLTKEFDGYMSNLQQQKKNLDPFDFKDLVENEPLLDGNQYRRTNVCPSKRIEKRTSFKDCTEILHHDIQSANILVNQYQKVKIANFGLSKKFSDATRSISHNLENISVGALLWEIAELKKPHSDLDKSEILGSVRKRMRERYYEPFSNDVPSEWRDIVSNAMEYERDWRSSISAICRDLYELMMKQHSDKSRPNSGFSYSNCENEISTPSGDHKVNLSANNNQSALVSSTFTILPVEDAIREHKSSNGSKLVAWNSFKFHSITNVEARYWEERVKNAIDIFKETADKGNSSAQLRYGMHLWQKENNYIDGFKYLKMSADSKDATAMFIVGKAYWNGINGIVQDKVLGAQYLKTAALADHPKARELCFKYGIS